MSMGGDLYEQEEKFFEFVKSRPENTVEEWIQSLKCPIIRIDGTKSIETGLFTARTAGNVSPADRPPSA